MGSNATPPERLALATRLLTEAVAAAGQKGKAAVAPRLGIGRSYLSRLMSPTDPCSLATKPDLVDKIIDRFYVVPECPATCQPRPRADCLRFALGRAPTHNPTSMLTWKICQTCEHKPKGGNS